MTAQEVGTVWGYADSEEAEGFFGHFATREEAIAAGRAHYGLKDGFWIVEGKECSPSEFTPEVDWILEDMSERAIDTVGDAVEDWPPEVSTEAKEELQAFLDAWANKNIRCDFWSSEGRPEYIEPEEGQGNAPERGGDGQSTDGEAPEGVG
jgi:hypothetical protein